MWSLVGTYNEHPEIYCSLEFTRNVKQLHLFTITSKTNQQDVATSRQFHQRFMREFFVQNYGAKNHKAKRN